VSLIGLGADSTAFKISSYINCRDFLLSLQPTNETAQFWSRASVQVSCQCVTPPWQS